MHAPIVLNRLYPALVLAIAVATVSATAPAEARSISVNLQLATNDNNSVDADETATSIYNVPGTAWNNLLLRSTTDMGVPDLFISQTTGGNSIALQDDMGNGNAAQLSSTIPSGGGYTNFAGVSGAGLPATGEAGLFQSFLNFGGAQPAETLIVSGLPSSAKYDVILYFEGNLGRTYGFTVDDGVTPAQTIWGLDDFDNSDINDDGIIEFKRAMGTSAGTANSANYARFNDLFGSGFTLSADTVSARAVLSGFQIVFQVPEPSTLMLLGAGLGLVATARPRRRRRDRVSQ